MGDKVQVAPDFNNPLTPADWLYNWKKVLALYVLLVLVAFCNATFSRSVQCKIPGPKSLKMKIVTKLMLGGINLHLLCL